MKKILAYVDKHGLFRLIIELHQIKNKHDLDLVEETRCLIHSFNPTRILIQVEVDEEENWINIGNIPSDEVQKFKTLAEELEPCQPNQLNRVVHTMNNILWGVTDQNNTKLISSCYSPYKAEITYIDEHKEEYDNLYLDISAHDLTLHTILSHIYKHDNLMTNYTPQPLCITNFPDIYNTLNQEDKRQLLSTIFNEIIEDDSTFINDYHLDEHLLTLSLSEKSLKKIALGVGTSSIRYGILYGYVYRGLPGVRGNMDESEHHTQIATTFILPNYKTVINHIIRHNYRLTNIRGSKSFKKLLENINIYQGMYENKAINITDFIQIDEDNCRAISAVLLTHYEKDIIIADSLMESCKEVFGDTLDWSYADEKIITRYFPYGVETEFSKHDSSPNEIQLSKYCFMHELMIHEFTEATGIVHMMNFLGVVDDQTFDEIKHWIAQRIASLHILVRKGGYVRSGFFGFDYEHVLNNPLLDNAKVTQITERLKEVFKIVYAYVEMSSNGHKYRHFESYVKENNLAFITDEIPFSKGHKAWLMVKKLKQ